MCLLFVVFIYLFAVAMLLLLNIADQADWTGWGRVLYFVESSCLHQQFNLDTHAIRNTTNSHYFFLPTTCSWPFPWVATCSTVHTETHSMN